MSTIVRETQAPAVTERERRARTLEAAALEIELRGWTQEVHCNDRGEVCLVGAVIAATGSPMRPAIYLGKNTFGPTWWGYELRGDDDWPLSIPNWNDEFGRTPADVTFLLRWRAEEIRDGR